MILKVGRVYKSPKYKDVVEILYIDRENKRVGLKILKDPNGYWKMTQHRYESITSFTYFFKELRGYNTKLWKIINE